jgi:hypothetical protein
MAKILLITLFSLAAFVYIAGVRWIGRKFLGPRKKANTGDHDKQPIDDGRET